MDGGIDEPTESTGLLSRDSVGSNYTTRTHRKPVFHDRAHGFNQGHSREAVRPANHHHHATHTRSKVTASRRPFSADPDHHTAPAQHTRVEPFTTPSGTKRNMAFCFQCIPNAEIGVIERFGKFQTLASPGFNCILWPLDKVVARLSTRVQQLDVRMETKTKDNVFVTAVVSVQYQPIKSKIYDAYYRLTSPQAQIRSYVFDVVRSTLPKLDLDQAFDSKEDIAIAVKNQLEEVMEEYGYQILQALVTDMDPDRRVKEAMNEINASKRLREAATNKAEADKIMQVKAAEAEAESKYLSGVGVSRQRKAIVDGLRDSVQTFSETIDGTSPKDVMDLLLLTQYFDMLRDVGQSSRSSTVFLPHAPQSVEALQSAMRDGFMQASAGQVGAHHPQQIKR